MTSNYKQKEVNAITFNEYDKALGSVNYIDLVNLMKQRLNMQEDDIDKIIDEHFDFAATEKSNYKSFIEYCNKFVVGSKMIQKSLF